MNSPLSSPLRNTVCVVGTVLLFGLYLGLMLLTAGGYCVKMLVDLVLTEIVTGFWRLGKRIGI